ncbi:hypothetical protein LOD99_16309 [Oopsacas minuta]|uniref:DUSP domain-containing protein n=1 Tax=Oopsacas minuta TaxID=111878 RepID=A0AAV7K8C8_9METZ|nr:hypothetical protein LOD99_16309 [Oopsacas minuta]
MAVAFSTSPIAKPNEFESVFSTPAPIDDNYLSINEARESIKTHFIAYHQMLDKKELELLSELDQLEAINKPGLIQVRNDLQRFKKLIPTLNDSLDTNTLKPFLEAQKSLLDKQILHFERSQKLLTHVTLEISTLESSLDNLIKIVPFLPKSKFRTKLQSLLSIEPQFNEEWYVVTQIWFSKFKNSINYDNPQTNDSWEFPESIPINHDGIYPNEEEDDKDDWKLLPFKAWDLLLQFNGMYSGSAPIKRKTFFSIDLNEIKVPIFPTLFKCVIGHNCADKTCTNFSIECQLETFPYETYHDILNKLSAFSKLYTNYPPRLFCLDRLYKVRLSLNKTEYAISKEITIQSQYNFIFSPSTVGITLSSTNNRLPTSMIGLSEQSFLLIVPDSIGKYNIEVTPKRLYRENEQIIFW